MGERVRMYVDGFNLWYGSLKGTDGQGVKWLDLVALAQSLAPGSDVDLVHYFTARIRSHPTRADGPRRQVAYLQALKHAGVVTTEGRYVFRKKHGRHANPPPKWVEYQYAEEKGSDVNLATYLILDGCHRSYDRALVISNDSSLAEPVMIVRDVLALPVVVFNPHPPNRSSAELKAACSSHRRLRRKTLQASQFPPTLTTSTGRVITKPTPW